ncbi:hypothetical protein WK33_12120 [Burkholderia multivorans]|nr:hypothetical protein WK22_19730 [Burkholderia multivorans]KOE24006.1 hypothetical protein AI46_21390 [Burkholderia multivorans R-20526]KVS13721.1 hypothetical protein WK33_12120 [Burkholderia multivorans]OFT77666.1 hypothetical protein HMPREF3115_25360 [Burkholderia sp. HMSC10F09]
MARVHHVRIDDHGRHACLFQRARSRAIASVPEAAGRHPFGISRIAASMRFSFASRTGHAGA